MDLLLMNNNYYDQNADEFFNRTINMDLSDLYNEFLPHIPLNGKILDAGCGSGRDAKAFQDKGYDVTATDASIEMVKKSSAVIEKPTLHLKFENMEFNNEFDGIWANASLLHVPSNDLQLVFKNLYNALKTHGVLYFSFKYGEGEEIKEDRLFNNQTEESIRKILASIPNFQEIKLWKTEDIRNTTLCSWLHGLLKKVE